MNKTVSRGLEGVIDAARELDRGMIQARQIKKEIERKLAIINKENQESRKNIKRREDRIIQLTISSKALLTEQEKQKKEIDRNIKTSLASCEIWKSEMIQKMQELFQHSKGNQRSFTDLQKLAKTLRETSESLSNHGSDAQMNDVAFQQELADLNGNFQKIKTLKSTITREKNKLLQLKQDNQKKHDVLCDEETQLESKLQTSRERLRNLTESVRKETLDVDKLDAENHMLKSKVNTLKDERKKLIEGFIPGSKFERQDIKLFLMVIEENDSKRKEACVKELQLLERRLKDSIARDEEVGRKLDAAMKQRENNSNTIVTLTEELAEHRRRGNGAAEKIRDLQRIFRNHQENITEELNKEDKLKARLKDVHSYNSMIKADINALRTKFQTYREHVSEIVRTGLEEVRELEKIKAEKQLETSKLRNLKISLEQSLKEELDKIEILKKEKDDSLKESQVKLKKKSEKRQKKVSELKRLQLELASKREAVQQQRQHIKMKTRDISELRKQLEKEGETVKKWNAEFASLSHRHESLMVGKREKLEKLQHQMQQLESQKN